VLSEFLETNSKAGNWPRMLGVIQTRNEMIALIRRSVDMGVTFSDTAEVYGPFKTHPTLPR
jgi:aryl-alcohol dehydrogenase-like predicted oxidoreductase